MANHGGKREGAGRKPTLDRAVKMSLALPLPMQKWIRSKAQQKGVTQSEVIRAAIAKAMK